MNPAQLIARKRDGEELGDEEITRFIEQYTGNEIPDYQMSAFAMAVYFQGMTTRETVALTTALLDSGTRLQWNDNKHKVDKHSTGGIGDKVSLVLAPLLACCGLQVPMLSGRGLGITGGTLDKLESIPGFRTDLSVTELQQITDEVGCVITGASSQLAPADRKLYGLRDVTATVPSQPLIVSSIMSKKLAENLSSLVLDVKCGSGAFMKSIEDARSLGEALVNVGTQMGVRTTALLTNMNQPLGRAVGNALEVHEAIECLQGGGPADVLELTIRLGCELLISEGIASSEGTARSKLMGHISDGTAYETFARMVAAQGGRLDAFDNAAEVTVYSIEAPTTGFVQSIDNAALGVHVIELGGGRREITDKIDHAVGLDVCVDVGSKVEKGQPLARLFARTNVDDTRLRDAFVISQSSVAELPLIHDRIETP